MTTKKNGKYHARRRIQRAFLAWFKESRGRLKLPFRITSRDDDIIILEFVRSGLQVLPLLNHHGLSVSLRWQQGTECSVLWNEARTRLTANGYECKQSSDPEEWGPDVYVHKDIRAYPTREDVWRVHLFEVFLDYVNNKLTKFPWIEVYEIPGTACVNGTWVSVESDYGVGLLNTREATLKNRLVKSIYVCSETDATGNSTESELDHPNVDYDTSRNRQIIPNPLFMA